MSDDDEDSKMASFLKDHPRLIGALFTLSVLLSQAAPVLAEGGDTGYGGP